jgi:hypothetical protein
MASHHHNCVFAQQNEVVTFATDLSVMTIYNTPSKYNIRSMEVCTYKKFQIFHQKDKPYEIFVSLKKRKKERKRRH